MRDEPLLTLRRLRRLALDEARLTLADCVTEETRAAAAISVHGRETVRGTLVGTALRP